MVEQTKNIAKAYSLLGLEYGSDLHTIHRMWKRKLKESHPDFGKDKKDELRRTKRAQELNEAYKVLGNACRKGLIPQGKKPTKAQPAPIPSPNTEAKTNKGINSKLRPKRPDHGNAKREDAFADLYQSWCDKKFWVDELAILSENPQVALPRDVCDALECIIRSVSRHSVMKEWWWPDIRILRPPYRKYAYPGSGTALITKRLEHMVRCLGLKSIGQEDFCNLRSLLWVTFGSMLKDRIGAEPGLFDLFFAVNTENTKLVESWIKMYQPGYINSRVYRQMSARNKGKRKPGKLAYAREVWYVQHKGRRLEEDVYKKLEQACQLYVVRTIIKYEWPQDSL
ncbi:MAG: J domain-containing protein [Coriobacteriales bacterium]|jgi:hypothetical protein|nr:J domain-containing protein [Coriobacteriales bacterium]